MELPLLPNPFGTALYTVFIVRSTVGPPYIRGFGGVDPPHSLRAHDRVASRILCGQWPAWTPAGTARFGTHQSPHEQWGYTASSPCSIRRFTAPCQPAENAGSWNGMNVLLTLECDLLARMYTSPPTPLSAHRTSCELRRSL